MFCMFFIGVGLIRKPIPLVTLWLLSIYIIKILYLNNLIHPVIGDLGIINYSNLFIAGMMFYLAMNKNLVIYHIIIGLSLFYQFIFISYFAGIVISIFYGVFYLLINNKLVFLRGKVLTFLGTISYSLYLVHQNIGYLIIDFLEQNGLIHEIYILFPIVFSLSIASIITFWIEKPIQKVIMKKYKLKLHREIASQKIAV